MYLYLYSQYIVPQFVFISTLNLHIYPCNKITSTLKKIILLEVYFDRRAFFSLCRDTSMRRQERIDKICPKVPGTHVYRNSIRVAGNRKLEESVRTGTMRGQLRSNCRHCRIGFVLEFQNALQMQCPPRKVHGLRCFLPTVRRNKSRLRKRVSPFIDSLRDNILFSEICHLFFSSFSYFFLFFLRLSS